MAILINSIVKYLKIPLDLKYRTSGIVKYLKIPLDLKYRTSGWNFLCVFVFHIGFDGMGCNSW
ncbi:hypothetical protein HJC23_014034, partial [Cyclotella cryptica]